MSKQPEYVEKAIAIGYKLHSLLGVLSQAADGEQITGESLAKCGGGTVIEMAGEMAGEIIEGLEIGGPR